MSGQPYIYGNATSKLEPEEKPRSRKIAKKPSEKQPCHASEPKRSFGDVLRCMVALIVCIVYVIILLGFYVQSERHVRQAELVRNEMQRKLDEQKEANDAPRVELNRKQDLEHIQDLVINCYGLVQPEPGQAIYCGRAEQGYVRQYEEILEETRPGK